MEDPSPNEAVHRMDENLPAVQMAVPAVEVLKQILEKMLENERRRVRNEFIRIGSLFLVFLLLILAGGVWIVRDILIQVKEARLMSEHSQEALLTLFAASNRQPPRKPGAAAPASENAGEIQQTISDLEDKNKALAELMQTEDGNLKGLLLDVVQTRDEEIRKLRARVNAQQAGAIAHDPVDLDTLSTRQSTAPPEQPEPPTVKVTLPDLPPVKSLTVPAAGDLPLRLPIPVP